MTTIALVQTKAVELANATDHLLISRYQGSVLYNAASESYAALRIPQSPATFGPDSALIFKQSTTVEGALNAYFYVGPKAKTALEIFRNYQQALRKAGFQTLFECELVSCDKGLIKEHFSNEALDRHSWNGDRMAPGNSFNRDIRFVSAKLTRAGRELYALVFVPEPTSTWEAPVVALVTVTPAPLEFDKVMVTTDALKNDLADEGKVLLYGLYFDTGKADLKPESKPQLDEMVKVHKENPPLNVLIVGHTDKQGLLEANLTLSQKRAQNVVAALISASVPAKQLMARGVANFAPVASNTTAAGRARNRRVEMVAR